MNKISVVLATYNEEENLSLCLDSIKDLADEIVVVDGSSTDKTVEIAKRYGSKVEVVANVSNFHINKQRAIDIAKGEWILQLDADEIVPRELGDEIRNVVVKKNAINGYWLSRKNWFLGRFLLKGGQFPDYTLRLYKRGKGRLPQKSVHEQAEVTGEVGYLHNSLLHYSYRNFDHYLLKWNRYNRLVSQQLREQLKRKSLREKIVIALSYVFIKPVWWFVMTYVRHKGFLDSWQGFIFAVFSALRFPASYLMYVKDSL